MRVHIVTPYTSAAMMRMYHPLLDELPKLHEVTTAETPDDTADVNIHFPFHTLVGYEGEHSKHIAVYTHCNPGMVAELQDACSKADIVTAMSFTGRQELLNFGVPAQKIWVVPCAADGFRYRPRRILIVGYPQPNGRKRESILLDLAWQYDLTPYEFILAGGGWEATAEKLNSLGVKGEVVHTLDDNKMLTLYQTADVMVVTGYMEGGPLPLLEAMACGTRVLSPRFGYAADYLEDDCLYDGPEELFEKLQDLTAESVTHHQIVRMWSWADYVAEYALLLGRLLGQSVDLYPERGMSRYCQLLDIIDRERPHSICEIGTWSGSNAIRMLQQASKYRPMNRLQYQGFDLFDSQTGEQFVRELSKVAYPKEVVWRRMQASGADIELIEGETYDTLNTKIRLMTDLIFVDGGHSEDTIEHDGNAALDILEYNRKATVVFDDYYHEGQPDGMGCNKFIDSLGPQYIVAHLPARTRSDDGRLIGMVQVKRADLHVQMPKTAYAGTYTLVSANGN